MPDWPHAPLHRLAESGAYMVTAGTYKKAHRLWNPQRLDLTQNALLATADEFGWRLAAWAVMSNHYHFLATSPDNPESLRVFLRKLHSQVAKRINELDGTTGNRVWYQYFETRITFDNSYYARLKYVNENPVHHGLVAAARNYRWCSAAWFEREAGSAFQKTIASFKIDRVKVIDPFVPQKVRE